MEGGRREGGVDGGTEGRGEGVWRWEERSGKRETEGGRERERELSKGKAWGHEVSGTIAIHLYAHTHTQHVHTQYANTHTQSKFGLPADEGIGLQRSIQPQVCARVYLAGCVFV